MRDYHRRPTRKKFDIKSSEINSSKKQRKKGTNGPKFGNEADPDYVWLLDLLCENIEQTKPPLEEATRHEDEHEDDDEDAKYKDPQYCMFLKQLTGNGKSYKLKISKNDETPGFLEYEEKYDPTTDMNVTFGNNGDKLEDMQIECTVERSSHEKKVEILKKKKVLKEIETQPQNDMNVDSCYQLFLESAIPSKYGAFNHEGKLVNYEEETTKSDSDTDSDILVWDKGQNLSEVNKQQLTLAKKEPSLRRKLMRILRKPYNEEEYEELSKYIEEEKPICRLLPLRDRAISSALDGLTKSVLDDGPQSFRKKLKAVKNERPRALNLMRMFCFWLEHLPNDKMFTPWSYKEFLEVLPSES